MSTNLADSGLRRSLFNSGIAGRTGPSTNLGPAGSRPVILSTSPWLDSAVANVLPALPYDIKDF